VERAVNACSVRSSKLAVETSSEKRKPCKYIGNGRGRANAHACTWSTRDAGGTTVEVDGESMSVDRKRCEMSAL